MPTSIKAKRLKKNIIIFEEIANNYFDYSSIHNRDSKNIKSRYTLHIKDYIGNKDIEYITASDIEKIQRDKLNQLAPKTVNHIIQCIGTIYNFAINREKHKGTNPKKK